MIHHLMYIELKTGYSDDGPAWIGYVKTSKTKKTIYFNDHAFQKQIGTYSNYIDMENGDEYWISGLKKKESNRHWAGGGKIMIDRRAVKEYLSFIEEKNLPSNLFEVVDIEDRFPVERINKLSNEEELKTGYSDDGPAWIGYVKTSKTKKTIYFNDHAFQKQIGTYSNYIDMENGDEYWISGLKKKESNRHWAGGGKIMIDRRAVKEYLSFIEEKNLPSNLFEVVDIEDRFPVERINKLSNEEGGLSCEIESF